ncbi:MAG: ABC transporter permease [Chloroflexi bacterium]|nr:ABC transporter permease [Chloroflexota bacterium]
MTTLDVQTVPTPAPAASDDILFQPIEASSSGFGSLWEVVRISFGSLLANKVRSLLTMLGVIIGVASVVSLLALGNGASASITGEIEAIGTNVLTISAGSQNRGPGNATAAQNLTMDDARAIEALQLPVIGVAPQLNSNAQIVAKSADKSAQIVGITPSFQVVNNLTMQQGSFITEEHLQGANTVIVLGSTLAKDLFGNGQAVGQTVRINNQSLRVVGVLTPQGGSAFGSEDDRAYIPITTAQKRLFNARTPDGNGYRVGSITLSAINASDLDALQSRVSMLLRERHHLKLDGSADDFNVINQAEILGTLTTITSMMTLFLAAVAGISLLVGGIGIMNIMLVSVTERTREIGLRKAVGARSHHILMQFVVEAAVLSMTGGMIGLMLGSIIPIVVTQMGLLDAPIDLQTVGVAIGFSLGVGLFFGIYPAQRAAKLNPIDALRHE